jgi:purine-binding chemotaxis protein CheW
LIVDSASDVVKIPMEDVEPPPAVFQEGGLNCVTGLGKYKNRLIVLLDMNKLLANSSTQRSDIDGELKGRVGTKDACTATAGK